MQTSDTRTGSRVDRRLPLSPVWESHVEEWIESEGIVKDADHFAGKVFRKKFFPILARVYLDELVVHTRRVKKVGEVEAHIVEELGLHTSTLTKWLDESNPPGADKFFAIALLVLKTELATIPLSDRRVLLFEAIRRQLGVFSDHFCEAPKCGMDRLVFRGLLHAMREPDVDKFCPGRAVAATARVEALKRITRRVNDGLVSDFESYSRLRLSFFGEPPVVVPEQLGLWLSSWGVPYTMLAIGTRDVPWEMNDAEI